MLSGILDVSIPWLLTGDGVGVVPRISDEADPDVAELMTELRFLRTEMLRSAERLGVIEKRLSRSMQKTAELSE